MHTRPGKRSRRARVLLISSHSYCFPHSITCRLASKVYIRAPIASSRAVVSQICVSSVCVLSPPRIQPDSAFLIHCCYTTPSFLAFASPFSRCARFRPAPGKPSHRPHPRMYVSPRPIVACTRSWSHCRIPAAASCFGARHLVYGADPRPATPFTIGASRQPTIAEVSQGLSYTLTLL